MWEIVTSGDKKERAIPANIFLDEDVLKNLKKF